MKLMSDGSIRKLHLLYFLQILQKYSDAEHPLLQKDILDLMKLEYGVSCERKAVSRNLGNLQDLGYEIEHIDQKGYYLKSRPFEDSELRLLIDSVMASRHIPEAQAKKLTEKLICQSSVYFKKQMRHVHNIERMEHDAGNQLFYTIEQISRAIEDGKKITFFYNKYGPDKKLRHTTKSKHLVNPYQIVVANGRYYLIGNVDKYSNVTHFRVEKITEIQVEKEAVKPQEQVDELKDGLDLPTHMAEHLYMFSGKSSWITLKVEEKGINDVIDWLGRDVDISRGGDDFLVRFKANEQSIGYWAVQFGSTVEVLEPERLRRQVAERVRKIYQKYKG